MEPNARTTCDAKRYSNLVNLHLRASMFGERKESVFLFEDEGKVLSDQKIMALQDLISIRVSKRLEPYVVSKARGKEVITYKDTQNSETHFVKPTFPSLTSIYETLMTIHLENDHASSKFVKAQTEAINDSYKRLPNICYDLILYFCKGCNKNDVGASARGSVSFMYQMSFIPETVFKSLMIYIDENTEFVFLRPINVMNIEVQNELFKLFMQIGTPEEINISHTCKMNYCLQSMIKILCPQCEITEDKDKENDKYLTRLIMNEIGAWMKTADSKIWHLGCSVVQNQLNNTIKTKIPGSDVKVTSYDLFYKNPAIFDPPMSSRWFPNIQRQFLVEDCTSNNTYRSNFRSRLKQMPQEASVKSSSRTEEQTKSMSEHTVPLSAKEAKKRNRMSYRGQVRGRGRPRKHSL